MSILSQLLHGKITFATAAQEAGSWSSRLAAKDPTLAAAAGAALSIVKQGASNAIMLADTELGKHMGVATEAVETALDGLLVNVTGGAALPFTPIVNAGIDQMAALLKQTVDAWALQAKSNLGAVPGSQAPLHGLTVAAPTIAQNGT